MHAHRGQAFRGVAPSFHLSSYQLSTQQTLRVCQLHAAGKRVALIHKFITLSAEFTGDTVLLRAENPFSEEGPTETIQVKIR